MKVQIASVHEEKKPNKYNICLLALLKKANIKAHIASVHERKNPFQRLRKCKTIQTHLYEIKDIGVVAI